MQTMLASGYYGKGLIERHSHRDGVIKEAFKPGSYRLFILSDTQYELFIIHDGSDEPTLRYYRSLGEAFALIENYFGTWLSDHFRDQVNRTINPLPKWGGEPAEPPIDRMITEQLTKLKESHQPIKRTIESMKS